MTKRLLRWAGKPKKEIPAVKEETTRRVIEVNLNNVLPQTQLPQCMFNIGFEGETSAERSRRIVDQIKRTWVGY